MSVGGVSSELVFAHPVVKAFRSCHPGSTSRTPEFYFLFSVFLPPLPKKTALHLT
jgi:hypothetical protein